MKNNPTKIAVAEAESNHEPSRAGAAHLLHLPGQEWALWSWVGVRGAGFPVDNVLSLASPAAAAASDKLMAAEDAIDSNRDLALQEVNAALDELRRAEEWENKERRGPLLDALRLLKSDKAPQRIGNGWNSPALQALVASGEKQQTAQTQFQQAYEASLKELSETIREISGSPRFREAVAWQNRNALRTGVDMLLKGQTNGSRGSKQRQYEELVVNYLQRYATKNDTIGFFGPVGWARFVDSGEGFTCRPGRNFLASRRVYFEQWTIDALANKIVENREARLWLAPLRMPFIRLEGSKAFHPEKGLLELSADEVALFERCDGNRTVREITSEVMQSSSFSLRSEQEVHQLLEDMCSRDLLVWNFIIPVDGYPERTLRRLIQKIGDERIRAEAIANLDELEARKAAVSEAAGNAEKLEAALEELESCFVRMTGQASTRMAGKLYASRTLVYEDCRRDIELNIGPDVWKELATPLGLLLTSARWYTYQHANLYKEKFGEIYEQSVRTTGSRFMEAGQFYLKAYPFFAGDQSDIVNGVLEDFRARWDSILSLPMNQQFVQYNSDDLRPLVEAAFAHAKPGWIGARYHSPDVLIDAKDQDALNRGEYQFVMGELHVGSNTMNYSLFVEQHPSPGDLMERVRHDMAGLKLVPFPIRPRSVLAARTTNVLIPPAMLRLEVVRDSFAPDRSKALQISEMVIERRDGELVLCTRDGQYRGDLIDIVGPGFLRRVVDSFQIISGLHPHSPRARIDRLVICRETWRIQPTEMTFAFEKSDSGRFHAARRWAIKTGLPRFVFAKVPVEGKPVYIDFDSPIFVDIFSKLVRRTIKNGKPADSVKITEMLPRHDSAWLPDSEGNRYTSELRIVAVDQV
jgi:Lantibiotic dehydratase, N terminus